MADMPLVEQGTTFGPPAGISMHALGSKMKDGSVTRSCSYRVEIPNGPRLLVVAPDLRPEDVEAEKIDVMIASPSNSQLLPIVRKVNPGLVVIDDTFLCQSLPRVQRLSLHQLYTLQKVLQPQRSILLAPGESWDVTLAR